MDGIYQHSTISATIAASASLSAAIPILGFDKIGIEIPTTTAFVSAAPTVYIQVAVTSTTSSFKRMQLVNESANTAASAVDWQVLTTSGNRIVPCNQVAGYAWLRIESSISATAAAGAAFVVHCIH
jgi:hypothetical protein